MSGNVGAVGAVITASHNEVQDNGIKIVDPTGGMIGGEWESYATKIANAVTAEQTAVVIEEIAKTMGADWSVRPQVRGLLQSIATGSVEQLVLGVCGERYSTF